MLKFIIKKNDADQTILSFLKKVIDNEKTQTSIHKLFRSKKIRINNKITKDWKLILKLDDTIVIYESNIFLKKVDNKFDFNMPSPDICYEDENILVVIKPHNLNVHNGNGTNLSLDKIVQNYLLQDSHNIESSHSFSVSHIHRLDKFTKGLIIYPKNKVYLNLLINKINDPKFIKKFYFTQIQGRLNANEIILEGYIAKDIELQKMVFTKRKRNNGKFCKTIFTEQKYISSTDTTNLIVQLFSGRKHQIRASLAFLNHPILNDQKYDANLINQDKMIYLIAYKIQFNNFEGEFEYLNDLNLSIPMDL